jgi:hypothetical protein
MNAHPSRQPSPEALVDAALVNLRRRIGISGRRSVCILLDPAAGEFASEIPTDLKHELRSVPVRYGDLDESLCPRLLWIDDEERSERLVNASVELSVREAINGLPRTLCAWILVDDDSATAPAVRLAAHLARAFVQVDTQGQYRFVRWFDPRVTTLIAPWVSVAQWQQLLGPSTAWMSVDLDGQMQTLLRDHILPTPTPTAQQAVFGVVDWQRLTRLGWLQQALEIAPQWALLHLSSAARVVAIDRVLARAQAAGLQAEDDALVFAACAFTVHPRFDEHPLAAQALARATGQNPTSFAQTVSNWPESTFEQIADGHWLASASRP